ncbi:Ig-like domain-containing protein [Methanobrevibacter wolinii]|uniref:Ig-like domain-containing protein n=1 Tax=Methanobrevibacter wolinii TaxID=190977 RepID=UPI000694EB85|nr:Ig-like domain repeat protein [Methanobrevibacter wolinii]
MKKYTVYPDDTRGIGNIMNSISSTDEMLGSNCTPSLTGQKITYDNIDFPVFEIKLKGETALLTIDAETWSIEPNGEVDLVATLKNTEGEAISNVDVYFYENDILLGSSETVDGTCQYTYSSDIRGDHTIIVKTLDELQYDATSTSVHVFVYHTTSLEISVSPSVIDSADTITVTADLGYDEGAGVVAGESVEFYNNTTLLGTGVTGDDGEAIFTVSAHDLKTTSDNVKFYARFGQTVQYLASESNTVESVINLSKPIIVLQYPIQQYNMGDTVPLTVVVTDKNNNALEGIQLTLTAGDITLNGVTDETGELQADYTFTANEDVEVTITNTADNFFEAVTTTAIVKCGKLATTTNLTLNSSSTSISFVEDYTLVATVSAADESTPTGDVVFYEDDTIIGTVSLSAGSAQLPYNNGSIGEHEYYAVYNETSNYLASTSQTSKLTITKDTPRLTVLTGDLYQGWYTACILTDSKGNPLGNKNIVISVSRDNSSFTDYSQVSTTDGKSKLQMNWSPCKVYSKYIFNGDSQYNNVSTNTTFTIKNPLSQRKVGNPMVSNPSSNSGNYRAWTDVSTDGEINPCGCPSVASKSGTYRIPANLQKNNWGFTIPSSAKINKIVCEWSAKNGTQSSVAVCINIPAATVTLEGSGNGKTLTGTGVVGGKNTFTKSTVTWNNPGSTAARVSYKDMLLTLKFGANTTGNTGNFYVLGPILTVYYIPAQGEI